MSPQAGDAIPVPNYELVKCSFT